MIVYFDTSAVVPLLVEEPGSEAAAQLWGEAHRVVSVRLVYPEGRAALAMACRMGRITQRQLRPLVRELDLLCEQIDMFELDRPLAAAAGSLAEQHSLRGYDAVHLAAARLLKDYELVLAAGDQALLNAAHAEGIHTAPTA